MREDSLYRRETRAKLIFIKFFLGNSLFLHDIKGMVFPTMRSGQSILAIEIFKEYGA